MQALAATCHYRPPYAVRPGACLLVCVSISTLRIYRCACGHRVYFRNSECLACGRPLGFLTTDLTLRALRPGPSPATWLAEGTDGVFTRCANFDSAAGCNWLVPLDDKGDGNVGRGCAVHHCVACALNRTIPDLSVDGNAALWGRMERAKRRLVSQLLGLGLPVEPKAEAPDRGLAYEFLRTLPGQPRVMTGHAHGVITINIEEADDAHREQARQQMGEPYRTLLGHFRHEVGHHYWDRLIAGTEWLAPFREVFGDERADYAAALRHNYRAGPPPDWPERFISSYAASHPWEDWAETWAHYLHLRDTIDTAASFGLLSAIEDVRPEPFSAADLWSAEHPTARAFLGLLHDWLDITSVMNEMSRAMGQPDFYPFVLAPRVVPKLHFIHCVIHATATATATATAPATATAIAAATPSPSFIDPS